MSSLQVGRLLTHYSAGKLPKAFKIIPSLTNWEEVMFVTNPWEWSPVAVRAATRIFASNLNPRAAQRLVATTERFSSLQRFLLNMSFVLVIYRPLSFYNIVLLERVRADIRSNRRLNYHLYMALKKSLYKPAAFYKGILLPLAEVLVNDL